MGVVEPVGWVTDDGAYHPVEEADERDEALMVELLTLRRRLAERQE